MQQAAEPILKAATDVKEVAFEPRRYLDDYFLDLNEEYQGLYRFWCSAVASLPRGLRALELGVGPTLYTTFPLAERFREIHLADYVPESLGEVRAWLRRDPAAFDWRPHIRLVLRAEGRPGTSREVAEREERVRRAVTRLAFCDLRSENPLGEEGAAYDLVTAHYCTEAATSNLAEWRGAVRNIAGLIRPGGHLLLSVATGLTLYRVYREDTLSRPSPELASAHVKVGLAEAGLDTRAMRLEFLPAPAGRPYRGTFLVFARKSAAP